MKDCVSPDEEDNRRLACPGCVLIEPWREQMVNCVSSLLEMEANWVFQFYTKIKYEINIKIHFL